MISKCIALLNEYPALQNYEGNLPWLRRQWRRENLCSDMRPTCRPSSMNLGGQIGKKLKELKGKIRLPITSRKPKLALSLN
jgi:hypothetical protein